MLFRGLLGIAFGLVVALPAWAGPDGAELYVRKGCIACHRMKGVPGATGTMGADLTKFWKPVKGEPPKDPREIAAFIKDPRLNNPNTSMPTIGLTSEEAAAIATYLLSKDKPAPSSKK